MVVVGNRDPRVPTLPEIARIKACLCLLRNATRDYLDFAALADRLGDRRTAAVVAAMDRCYADQLGADVRRVVCQSCQGRSSLRYAYAAALGGGISIVFRSNASGAPLQLNSET